MNANLTTTALAPEVIKEGSVSVTIWATRNRIYRVNPVTGRKKLKPEHPRFTRVRYLGNRRIKQKSRRLKRPASRQASSSLNQPTAKPKS